MALSDRFRQMRSEINNLRLYMLPKTFSSTGNYSARQLSRTRGYRLLVHAEIESYLEDRAKQSVIHAIRSWKRDHVPTVTLLSFFASYHSSWKEGDDDNNTRLIGYAKERAKVVDSSINEIIDHAQHQFIQRIKDNHGIREYNLRTLLNPVGIDIDALDPTWVTNMDSFGQARGEIAHNTLRATSAIDPQDELVKVSSLLAGLEDLDRRINSLS